METISFLIEPQKKRLLAAVAALQGKTLSDLVRDTLNDRFQLDQLKPEAVLLSAAGDSEKNKAV